MPYGSELQGEGEGMKAVESLLIKHVSVKGRRREREHSGSRQKVRVLEVSIIVFESRETVVQRKLKRRDNQMH